jgi:hypothetical protein
MATYRLLSNRSLFSVAKIVPRLGLLFVITCAMLQNPQRCNAQGGTQGGSNYNTLTGWAHQVDEITSTTGPSRDFAAGDKLGIIAGGVAKNVWGQQVWVRFRLRITSSAGTHGEVSLTSELSPNSEHDFAQAAYLEYTTPTGSDCKASYTGSATLEMSYDNDFTDDDQVPLSSKSIVFLKI